jgi:quercetin dioxygenase-like cupin family protein
MRHVAVAALAVATAAAAAAPLPPGTLQRWPESIAWAPGSAAMPPGTEVAVLEGDPGAQRWFTIRLKVPAGSVIRPHRHPRDERVTVLSGAVWVGFGEVVDEAAVARFGPGSFYVNPAHHAHYVLFPQDSVVQVTGVGPWQVEFIDAPAASGATAPAAAPER